jgi:hypothetical protein
MAWTVGSEPSLCSGVVGRKLRCVSRAAAVPLVSAPLSSSSLDMSTGPQFCSTASSETWMLGLSKGIAFWPCLSCGMFQTISIRYRWSLLSTS